MRVKIDEFTTMEEAVQSGISYGIHRAFKYREYGMSYAELYAFLESEDFKNTLTDSVMADVCEVFELNEAD